MRTSGKVLGQRQVSTEQAQEYGWEHVAQKVLDYYIRILSEPPWKKHLPEVEAVSV